VTEPHWISIAELVRIDQKEVSATAEPHLVVDQGGLAAAAARPQLAFDYGTTDVALLGALLAMSVCVRHPFLQGNKRTGHTAAITFFRLNGYRETIPDDGRSAHWLLDALDGKLGEDGLAQLYAEHLIPSDTPR
jgi:death-on-curing protein